MPAPRNERTPILAGDLSEFSVQSLMSAFSLGRQTVAIEVLDAHGSYSSRIVMKGGRVLSASAAGRTGVAAVQHLLASAVPAKFRVVREVSDVFARAPHLGTLAEVTGASTAPRKGPSLVSRTAHARTRVMEGTLADFDLATVLQVVSTARQHTVMEVLDLRGQRAGSVQLKAGKILRAEAGLLKGVAAVQRLLTAPSSFRFIVYRALDDDELPLLGAVDEVLMRAAMDPMPLPPVPSRRPGLHLAPAPLAPPQAELDPDEIETLIPVSSAPDDDDDGHEIDDALNELDPLDDLEDEVTRVSDRALLLATPAGGPHEPVPVLDGRLSDFDLGSVLQVAGLSRQPTSVRIFDDQRQPVGEVRVQGGQLLAASAQGQRDQTALRFLLHSPRDFYFSVLRLPPHSNLVLAPLGTVAELLQLATEHRPAPAEELAPDQQRERGEALFRAQAPSLPAPASQTWRRALGVGLLLGAAAGVVATLRLLPDDTSTAESAGTGLQQPAPPAAMPAAAAGSAPPTRAALAPATAPVAAAPSAPQVQPMVSVSPVFMPAAERSRAEVASIQGALRMLGFGPGPIDGVPGPITRSAIAAFQRKEGLPEDGELSPATEQRLQARIRPQTER